MYPERSCSKSEKTDALPKMMQRVLLYSLWYSGKSCRRHTALPVQRFLSYKNP